MRAAILEYPGSDFRWTDGDVSGHGVLVRCLRTALGGRRAHWWREEGLGYTDNRNEANVFTQVSLPQNALNAGNTIEVLEADEAEVAEPMAAAVTDTPPLIEPPFMVVIPRAEFCYNNTEAEEIQEGPLGERPCIVEKNGGWLMYDGEGGEGIVEDRNLATVLPFSEHYSNGDNDCEYHVLPDKPWPKPEPAKPEEPRKKIHTLFSRDVIELMKLAPKNPMVAGFVLKRLKVMPPTEADTYEKLVDWVEAFEVPVDPKPATPKGHISVTVTITRTAVGTARYSLREDASTEVEIDSGTIEDALEDSESPNELYRALADELSEAALDSSPVFDSGDESYHYSDHDTTDWQDEETDWNSSMMKNKIKEYVRQHYPEKYHELYENV